MKNSVLFVCLALLIYTRVFSQQTKAVDSKGTKIVDLYFPSVCITYPFNVNVDRFQNVDEKNNDSFDQIALGDHDSSITDDDVYDVVANGIRVKKDGLYKVFYSVSTIARENRAMGGEVQLSLNGSPVANTNLFTYQDRKGTDKDTATGLKIMQLNSGQIVGIQVRVYESALSGLETQFSVVTLGTRLSMMKLNSH